MLEQPDDAQATPEAETGEDAAEAEGEQAETPAERVEALRARTDGWAYQVSDFLFGRLTKPRADWVEDASTS